ncbi:MAG: hypothetical protein V2A63_03235 [Patescibacteria group bacterium]
MNRAEAIPEIPVGERITLRLNKKVLIDGIKVELTGTWIDPNSRQKDLFVYALLKIGDTMKSIKNFGKTQIKIGNRIFLASCKFDAQRGEIEELILAELSREVIEQTLR